jgi:hypothetical protein
MQKVFVIDVDGTPGLPCCPARARKLLGQKKAVVEQVMPFTIRLKTKIDNPVGVFKVGVDDGAKKAGVAVANDKTNEIVFKGEIELRQDVKRLVKQRREYRRSRRCRKLRHRKPRFNNRISSKVVPSIKCRKESIVRVIRDMSKRLNIAKVTVEEVGFNHRRYRHGRFFSLVEQGKQYLREQLESCGYDYSFCYGYDTKQNRLELGLSKTHANDAIAICCKKISTISSKLWVVKPKRCKVGENNPTKTCSSKNGFHHYDVVKAVRNGKEVIGSIRSLKSREISLRAIHSDNFLVRYSLTKLLYRPKRLIYM